MDSSINFIDVAALTQDEKNTQLLNAAEAGDMEKIGVLLQAGANIEATDKGEAALHLAAMYGHTDAVAQLIAAHANIDATSESGETALMWAAYNGHTAVVGQLIEAGANKEIADRDGNTALMLAASYGHTAVVAQLIKAGAAIESTNQIGETALSVTERKHHQNTAFLILRAMSPASRAAVKFGQGGCALNRRLAENPVARLAARYEAMASDFERQVCEMYQFFSHPSRSMVNPALTIMLEYLQAEWLLNANMEAERVSVKSSTLLTF